MSQLIAPTVNILILVGLLAYYLRQPLKQFVTQRHETVRDELVRVRDLLRQAHGRYDEFSAKLRAIDAETFSLRQQFLQDAQAAKLKVLSDCERLSSGILADSRSAAETLYSELRSQLYSELGSRVLGRAEALLRDRLTGADQARIRAEFSSQVENVQ